MTRLGQRSVETTPENLRIVLQVAGGLAEDEAAIVAPHVYSLLEVADRHSQTGRPDGWGCACGWQQDQPHAEHIASVVTAANVAAARQ